MEGRSIMKREILNTSDKETWKVINAEHTCFEGSRFVHLDAERMYFENVSIAGTKLTNVNMSNIIIDGAQMGGAYIHNIGIPEKGDANFNAGTANKPIIFEKCDLNNVEIKNCEVNGMKINGILVEDLLEYYKTVKTP